MTALAVEIAYAKINLALHVRRRRDDGYHDIETLFAFADDGDRLSGELAGDISLAIRGPFGSGLSIAENLVLQTATLIKSHFDIRHGARLLLDKRLPIASGIGGGSADAAATGRLLNRLWDIGASERELEHLLAPLGADIAACVRSATVYGDGIGTGLHPVDDAEICGRALLLVNPVVAVSTATVFDKWDGIDRGALQDGNPWEAAVAGRNDLEKPALELCPVLSDVLASLRETSADLVRMSGSGATCFALYASAAKRDHALRHINAACPAYWTMASFLR